MRAVSSYAALPLRRSSHILKVDNDLRYVAGSAVSSRSNGSKTGRSSLSDTRSRHRDRKRQSSSFDTIFAKVTEYVQSIFMSEKEHLTIHNLLQTAYNVGLKLCKDGSASYTKENIKQFFNLWRKFATELSAYFQISADDRLIEFADDTIAKINETIKPLILPDAEDDVVWLNAYTEFQNGLEELKSCFATDFINATSAQRLINCLMNQSESSTNEFFRNDRTKPSHQDQIVFQCHYRFTRLVDALFEYIEDEPLAREIVAELNLITTELYGMFTPEKGETKYVDMLTKKELRSRDCRIPTQRPSFADQAQSIMRLSHTEKPLRKTVEVRNKREKLSKTTNHITYSERINELTLELSQLKKHHNTLREDIKEYMSRKSLTMDAIMELRHRQYVAVHHQNMLMGDTIKLLSEQISTLEKDSKGWESVNAELEQGRETQTVVFSNEKLRSDLKKLKSELEKASSELEFLMNQRTRIVDVKGGMRDDYLLGWRYLCLESAEYKSMNVELESRQLEIQKLITQLQEKPAPPKHRPGRTESTQQLQELLSKKLTDIADLKQLRSETGRVSIPHEVEEVMPAPTPELQLAHRKLAESRDRKRRMIDYALSVQNELVTAVMQSEQQQVELIKLRKKFDQAGIRYEYQSPIKEKLRREQEKLIQIQVEMDSLSSLFDVWFGSNKRRDLSLSDKLRNLQKRIKFK